MLPRIDFRNIGRFLACPGSEIIAARADLMFGPEQNGNSSSEIAAEWADRLDGQVYLDEPLDLTPLLPMSGTADAVVCSDGQLAIAMVGLSDYRSLLLAAMAAHAKYDFRFEFKQYRMVVLNHDGIAHDETIDMETLVAAGQGLRDQVNAALQTVQLDRNALHPNVSCETCPGRAICPALEEKLADARLDDFKDATGAQLSAVASLVDSVQKSAYGAIQGLLEQGKPVPGYKLSDPVLVWKDPEKTAKYLKRNVKKFATNCTNRELKSPAELAALLETMETDRPVHIDRLTEELPRGVIKDG